MNNKSSLIKKALRNAAIAEWWNAITESNRKYILTCYAEMNKWPLTEVNPQMNGLKDFDYLYSVFPSSIELHQQGLEFERNTQ